MQRHNLSGEGEVKGLTAVGSEDSGRKRITVMGNSFEEFSCKGDGWREIAIMGAGVKTGLSVRRRKYKRKEGRR